METYKNNIEYTIFKEIEKKIKELVGNSVKAEKYYWPNYEKNNFEKIFNEFLNNEVSKVFNNIIFYSEYDLKNKNLDFYLVVAKNYDYQYRVVEKNFEQEKKNYIFNYNDLSITEKFKFKNNIDTYESTSTDKDFLQNIKSCLTKEDELTKRKNLNIILYKNILSQNKTLKNYISSSIGIPIKKEYLYDYKVNVVFNNEDGKINIEIIYNLKKDFTKDEVFTVEFDKNTIFIHQMLESIEKNKLIVSDDKFNEITFKEKPSLANVINTIKCCYSKVYELQDLGNNRYKVVGLKYNKDSEKNIIIEGLNKIKKFYCNQNCNPNFIFENDNTVETEVSYFKDYKYKENGQLREDAESCVYRLFDDFLKYYNLAKTYFEEKKEDGSGNYLLLYKEKFYYTKNNYYTLFIKELEKDFEEVLKDKNFITNNIEEIENILNNNSPDDKKERYLKLIKDYLYNLKFKDKYSKNFKEFYDNFNINEDIEFKIGEKNIHLFDFFKLTSETIEKYKSCLKNIKMCYLDSFSLDIIKEILKKKLKEDINCNNIVDIYYKDGDNYYTIFDETKTKTKKINKIKNFYLVFDESIYGFDAKKYYTELRDNNLFSYFKEIRKQSTNKNNIPLIFRKINIKEINTFKPYCICNFLCFDVIRDNDVKEKITEFFYKSYLFNLVGVKYFKFNDDSIEYFFQNSYNYNIKADTYLVKYFGKSYEEMLSINKEKFEKDTNITENIKKYLLDNSNEKFFKTEDEEIINYIEELKKTVNGKEFEKLFDLEKIDFFIQILNLVITYDSLDKKIRDMFEKKLSPNKFYYFFKKRNIDYKSLNLENIKDKTIEQIYSSNQLKCNYLINNVQVIYLNNSLFDDIYNIDNYHAILNNIKMFQNDDKKISEYITKYNDETTLAGKSTILDEIRNNISTWKNNAKSYDCQEACDIINNRLTEFDPILKKHEEFKNNKVLLYKENMNNFKEKCKLNNVFDDDFKVEYDNNIQEFFTSSKITDITKIKDEELSDDLLIKFGENAVLMNSVKNFNNRVTQNNEYNNLNKDIIQHLTSDNLPLIQQKLAEFDEKVKKINDDNIKNNIETSIKKLKAYRDDIIKKIEEERKKEEEEKKRKEEEEKKKKEEEGKNKEEEEVPIKKNKKNKCCKCYKNRKSKTIKHKNNITKKNQKKGKCSCSN